MTVPQNKCETSRAGNQFQTRETLTSNDLSFSQVLVCKPSWTQTGEGEAKPASYETCRNSSKWKVFDKWTTLSNLCSYFPDLLSKFVHVGLGEWPYNVLDWNTASENVLEDTLRTDQATKSGFHAFAFNTNLYRWAEISTIIQNFNN